MLYTQTFSARKITTIFRYVQVFPDFCKIYLSKTIFVICRPLHCLTASLNDLITIRLYISLTANEVSGLLSFSASARSFNRKTVFQAVAEVSWIFQ